MTDRFGESAGSAATHEMGAAPWEVTGRFSPQTLGNDLHRFARDHSLGAERLDTDKVRWELGRPGEAKPGKALMIARRSALAAGFVLGWVLIISSLLQTSEFAPARERPLFWLGVLLTAGSVAAGTAVALAGSNLRPAPLYCFDEGLVGAHPDGVLHLWRWRDVPQLYEWAIDQHLNGVHVTTHHFLRLGLADGREVSVVGAVKARMRGFDDQLVLALREWIIAEVGRRVLATTVQQLLDGAAVTFGPLTARPDGLRTPAGGLVSWASLPGALHVREGNLCVLPAPGRAAWKAPVSTIPNLMVLTALPEVLRQAQ